jgi:hypothetical protein
MLSHNKRLPLLRMQRMAKPLLAEMTPEPETLKIGVHIRVGDSGLSNALKRNDERYPPGCDCADARLLCYIRTGVGAHIHGTFT